MAELLDITSGWRMTRAQQRMHGDAANKPSVPRPPPPPPDCFTRPPPVDGDHPSPVQPQSAEAFLLSNPETSYYGDGESSGKASTKYTRRGGRKRRAVADTSSLVAWTEEEDMALAKLVAQDGTQHVGWAQKAAALGSGRTAAAVAQHWYISNRKPATEGAGADDGYHWTTEEEERLRACPPARGRLSALRVFHSHSVLDG